MAKNEPCRAAATANAGAAVAANEAAFAPGAGAELAGTAILHEPKTRLSNRKVTLFVCIGAVAALAAIVIAGLFMNGTATKTDFAAKNMAPCLAHVFGTDWMGRDMLARTLAGLSTSVLLGLVAATASAFIALVLASVAALGGKRADAVVTWLVDLVLGVPHIVLRPAGARFRDVSQGNRGLP